MKMHVTYVQAGRAQVSHKTLAVSTVIIVVTLVTLAVFLAETYATLESINPIAAVAAAIVVVAGLVWFKKTNK